MDPYRHEDAGEAKALELKLELVAGRRRRRQKAPTHGCATAGTWTTAAGSGGAAARPRCFPNASSCGHRCGSRTVRRWRTAAVFRVALSVVWYTAVLYIRSGAREFLWNHISSYSNLLLLQNNYEWLHVLLIPSETQRTWSMYSTMLYRTALHIRVRKVGASRL